MCGHCVGVCLSACACMCVGANAYLCMCGLGGTGEEARSYERVAPQHHGAHFVDEERDQHCLKRRENKVLNCMCVHVSVYMYVCMYACGSRVCMGVPNKPANTHSYSWMQVRVCSVHTYLSQYNLNPPPPPPHTHTHRHRHTRSSRGQRDHFHGL